MQFSRDTIEQKFFIRSFESNVFKINDQSYETSLLISHNSLAPWQKTQLSELTDEDFKTLSALEVEVILLGTGAKQYFLPFHQQKILLMKGIGIEAMSTHAACKTYNILVAEGRKVAALLLIQ
ncbi:hypothetical protein PsalN5692_02554 [Piscirickettsia salmonis]|uniref:Mth938-like domain-containing protein n=1 Tax=Piscirickettsia salmonis TaxID=1238 RepID=UPI0012B818BC|nr:MTH938/NDUFAF3 family protein [Piscirickettsia salmonis]QGP51079.1 hypothetical protein PsalN5692_02554 [Piscirickettsia salmonis]QGP55796.1 hypothetical protein PsalSR1_03253 [Piscirickettsia salmonis]QGP58335.1 hypothetical protein PsalBI1_00903 [Piscirickettsia salmonis]QGP65366.1 hypothetical protein PsalMR5_03259 [Piscirickettsia salmonis]